MSINELIINKNYYQAKCEILRSQLDDPHTDVYNYGLALCNYNLGNFEIAFEQINYLITEIDSVDDEGIDSGPIYLLKMLIEEKLGADLEDLHQLCEKAQRGHRGLDGVIYEELTNLYYANSVNTLVMSEPKWFEIEVTKVINESNILLENIE